MVEAVLFRNGCHEDLPGVLAVVQALSGLWNFVQYVWLQKHIATVIIRITGGL